MKRAMSLLIGILLLLSLVGCGVTQEPDAKEPTGTTATTAAIKPTGTAAPQSDADDGAQLDAYFTAIKEKNAEKLTAYLGSKEVAKEIAKTVSLTDYQWKKESGNTYRVHLSCAESKFSPISAGESDWWAIPAKEPFETVLLCPIKKTPKDVFGGDTGFAGTSDPAVGFCTEFADELALYEDVADFGKLSKDWAVKNAAALARLYNLCRQFCDPSAKTEEYVSADALTTFTEKMLGIRGADFTKSSAYTDGQGVAADNTGHTSHYTLLAHTQKSGTHTVMVRLYADASYLAEAATMVYTLAETNDLYRMTSARRISGGKYAPAQFAA